MKNTLATLLALALSSVYGWAQGTKLNFYNTNSTAVVDARVTSLTTKRWNVMRYGASGTGNKDLDSPAFKTAWDNARNYGGVVYAPRGLYTDTNSYAIPNSSTNGSHGVQGGTEIFVEGDGMDASIVYVACTNATYLNCLGQLVGLKGLTLYNVNRTTSSITNLALTATNFVGGAAGVAGLFDSVKLEGFWMGADIGAHDGFRARSIELRDCYIGMRLSGYSDGVIVEGRSDACKAGVVVGGLVPKYGISRINGIQLKMEGNGDGYHVVVGGGCNGVWISGAFEQTTNAAVAIGYPPNLLPDNSYSETTTAGPVTIHGLWGSTQVGGDVFCKLFVKCYRLSINASRGGDMIVSTSAAADATQWEVVNSQWAGVLMTFSTASTFDGTGQSDWAAYRYSWNEMGLYSAVSNTWNTAGFFYGQNGQFGTLKANSAFVTNDLRITSGALHGVVGASNIVGEISSANLSSNVVEIPDASWNARPAGNAVFPIWNDADQEFQFTTNFAAGGITGVLPSGTVAINSMVAGKILGNNGTSRLWTNEVETLTVKSNASSPTALIVNGNQTVNGTLYATNTTSRFKDVAASIEFDLYNTTAAAAADTIAQRAISLFPSVSGSYGINWGANAKLRASQIASGSDQGSPANTTAYFWSPANGMWLAQSNLTVGNNLIVSNSISAGTISGYSYVTPTNSATHAPDFTKSAQLYVTNNNTLVLTQPTGIDSTKYQEMLYVVIGGGTGTAITTTGLGTTRLYGTWYVTNETQIKFQAWGNRFTNAIATPMF